MKSLRTVRELQKKKIGHKLDTIYEMGLRHGLEAGEITSIIATHVAVTCMLGGYDLTKYLKSMTDVWENLENQKDKITNAITNDTTVN